MRPLLPELIEGQARATPGAPAVVSGDSEVTYQELARAARRIAGRSSGRGTW